MKWSELFTYDEATGNLIWKPRIGTPKQVNAFNKRFAGKVAGAMAYAPNGDPRGIVVRVRLNGRKDDFYAHRIISEMFDGPIPEGIQIDHADGNPFNNRRSNHRRATPTQNRHNMRITSRNSCGVKGVYYEKSRGLWVATLRSNGTIYRLGRFQTKGLAAVARAKAAIRYHGEFARFA
jgi:hypothetical protein